MDAAQKLWSSGRLPKHVAEKPTPSPGRMHEPPPSLGERYFHELFELFFIRLGSARIMDIAAWFQHEAPHPLQLASICSGTDIPTVIWQAFVDVLDHTTGAVARVQHVFSAEKDSSKQRFLRKVHPALDVLFADCLELPNDVAYEVISNQHIQVMSAHGLTGGFPCTDGSSLNPQATSAGNRSCILTDSLRAGSVFRSVLRWKQQHGKQCFFFNLENVTALSYAPKIDGEVVGPDNLTTASYLLSSVIDFYTKTFELDPRLFGVPQCRQETPLDDQHLSGEAHSRRAHRHDRRRDGLNGHGGLSWLPRA